MSRTRIVKGKITEHVKKQDWSIVETGKEKGISFG